MKQQLKQQHEGKKITKHGLAPCCSLLHRIQSSFHKSLSFLWLLIKLMVYQLKRSVNTIPSLFRFWSFCWNDDKILPHGVCWNSSLFLQKLQFCYRLLGCWRLVWQRCKCRPVRANSHISTDMTKEYWTAPNKTPFVHNVYDVICLQMEFCK